MERHIVSWHSMLHVDGNTIPLLPKKTDVVSSREYETAVKVLSRLESSIRGVGELPWVTS